MKTKNFKIDKRKVKKFLGQAVLYISLNIVASISVYQIFLNCITVYS